MVILTTHLLFRLFALLASFKKNTNFSIFIFVQHWTWQSVFL